MIECCFVDEFNSCEFNYVENIFVILLNKVDH